MARIALTGGSGFVGRQTLVALLDAGHHVNALVRHPTKLPTRTGLSTIVGTLDQADALERLVGDADAVVHIAGATAGRNYLDLARTNAAGTARLIDAITRHRPSARLIHLSSLAARHPGLSDYAASKRAGEELVSHSSLDWVIVRPPAVYGPDDPSLAPVWRLLARGWLLRTGPANARFSLLHVADLAAALCKLATRPDCPNNKSSRQTITLHDGRSNGYSWDEIASIAGNKRGGRVRIVPVPAAILHLLGAINLLKARLLKSRPPPLVPGKVRELVHRDWVCDNTRLPGCPEWKPSMKLETALDDLPGWRSPS